MIDTIFYFCPTQEEYDRTADTTNGGEGISDKTITFVEDVREIYLNGKGYGKTSTAGLVSDDRLTSTITALQESLSNTILQTNTNLDAVEADLLQQLTTAETGIQNTIAVLRSDTEGAISRLKTEVLDDVDEGFVAKANLDTYVTNAVKDGLGISSLADVALKSDITSSEATISTRFLTVEGNVSTLQGGLTTTNSSLATLQAQSDADHAKIAAVADWSGWVEGQPVSFNGGLITQANADGVIAGLIANSNSDVAAAVSAQVTRGTSNITLSADKIYLDANTTLANTILATQGNIAGFTISNNSLSASLGDYSIELTPYHFATFKNSTLTNEIKSDGSGSIASGGITWNNNGTITLSLEFLRSLFNALHNGAVNLDVYGGINETFVIDQGGYNTGGDYIDNLAELRSESSLWLNSWDPSYRMWYITTYGTYDNTRRPQDYPFSGTLAEKQNWFVRSRSTVGKFVSGILTEKTYVDPETGLEKEELSELYIDHHINIVHLPTLTEFAQNNGLDINKFVGCAQNTSTSANPYMNGVRYEVTSYLTYSGAYNNLWNTLIYYYGVGGNLTLLILDGTILFVENRSSEVLHPYIFRNPLEGSWGFVVSVIVHISELSGENVAYYNALAPSGNVNNYPSWSGRSDGDLFLVKYTNGAWRIVTNITPVSETKVQYRANETE